MKCSNSAFDAQGWRVITVVLHVRRGKIYVAGGKMKDKVLSPKFESQLFRLKKVSFPIMHLMSYYAETGCSQP
jgi:hypothetical protein